MPSKTRSTKEPVIHSRCQSGSKDACTKRKEEQQRTKSLFHVAHVPLERLPRGKTRSHSCFDLIVRKERLIRPAMERERLTSRGKDLARSNRTFLESKMQRCLERLGVPLKVLWSPQTDKCIHGEINSDCIFIYDRDESEAWFTLEHEVLEYKSKEVTYPYRTLVNNLIETVEKLIYERKERFLESLPRIIETISREKNQVSSFLYR